jgi:hypothetical protein
MAQLQNDGVDRRVWTVPQIRQELSKSSDLGSDVTKLKHIYESMTLKFAKPKWSSDVRPNAARSVYFDFSWRKHRYLHHFVDSARKISTAV